MVVIINERAQPFIEFCIIVFTPKKNDPTSKELSIDQKSAGGRGGLCGRFPIKPKDCNSGKMPTENHRCRT
jgi:hypothetical protein